MKSLLLLITTVLISCSSPPPSWQPILADALNHAIALEKLPDVYQVLSKSDTIWIFPVKYDNKVKLLDETLEDDLPYHIDKWTIKSLDSLLIKEKAKLNNFSYLSISYKLVNNECIVDIIQETSFPPNSDLYLIDRGRITITYEYKNDLWVVKDLVQWYG